MLLFEQLVCTHTQSHYVSFILVLTWYISCSLKYRNYYFKELTNKKILYRDCSIILLWFDFVSTFTEISIIDCMHNLELHSFIKDLNVTSIKIHNGCQTWIFKDDTISSIVVHLKFHQAIFLFEMKVIWSFGTIRHFIVLFIWGYTNFVWQPILSKLLLSWFIFYPKRL